MEQDIHNYDDIINLPHHTSLSHPQMDILNRAAQFSPFAALTGYEEAINETARLTEQRVELDEGEKARLDEELVYIRQSQRENPSVSFTYFEEDSTKAGGSYKVYTGRVKRIDESERKIHFVDGNVLSMEDIVRIDREWVCKK